MEPPPAAAEKDAPAVPEDESPTWCTDEDAKVVASRTANRQGNSAIPSGSGVCAPVYPAKTQVKNKASPHRWSGCVSSDRWRIWSVVCSHCFGAGLAGAVIQQGSWRARPSTARNGMSRCSKELPGSLFPESSRLQPHEGCERPLETWPDRRAGGFLDPPG